MQQVCIRTHFSGRRDTAGWNPIRGRWREFRTDRGEHAALPEQVYERALIGSIANGACMRLTPEDQAVVVLDAIRDCINPESGMAHLPDVARCA